jgi:hypothetical protein
MAEDKGDAEELVVLPHLESSDPPGDAGPQKGDALFAPASVAKIVAAVRNA